MIVDGNQLAEKLRYLEFTVERCNNLTSPVPCQDESVINERLKKTRIKIKFEDRQFDYPNHLEPIENIFREYIADIVEIPGVVKNVNFYFRDIQITTDSGLIMSIIWNLNSFFVHHISEIFENKEYTDQIL